MFYALVALVCAVVGIIPLALSRKPIASTVQGVISFFLLWWFLYLGANSTVWPLFGVPGLYVFILWIIAAIVISVSDEAEGVQYFFAWTPVVLAFVVYIGAFFFGSEFVNTSSYQTMIGQVETRIWTQDIQPKDPKHMRMSNEDNALYLAQKAIGQDGTIGSQFEVESNEVTLQLIKGELWYVAPLEFRGYSTWSSNGTSPGYVMVSAENQELQPKLVKFPEGQGMRYSPSAYFDYDLERHLRQNGYLDRDIAAFNFEIDEHQKAWWIVTISKPTIMWWGDKVQGVAIVDPTTGDSTFYPLGSVPNWVDRVVPSSYVKNYIEWWGEYRHGWWNTWWAKQDMVKPGDMSLIYGENYEPEWVTDVTSTNGKDNSLVGMMYTNSRTGKSVYYIVPGGGTNSAVLDAVNNNPQINYRKLHGTDPQLYNVYGTMACVVPLFNDSHAFQGVAIVPVNNVQQVATGATQYEALRQYEKLLSNQGGIVALDKERSLKTVDGVVDRVSFDTSGTGNIYYVHVPGVPHLFTGGSTDWPKLPVTEKGDKVRIGYYDSDRDVVPLHNFDNLSLVLSESKDQATVSTNASEARQGQEAAQDANTVRSELQGLSDQQLQELKSKMPTKPKQ
jgi:hypothetical protein